MWRLAIILLLYALDQVTKWWVISNIPLGGSIVVIPGLFTLVHTYNTGMAFGLFGGNNGFFIVFASLALGVLAWFYRKPKYRAGWLGLGLTVLMPGIMGNLTDRIIHGHVIDFLSVHYQTWAWPSFNVADSCICISVVLMFIAHFRGELDEPVQNRAPKNEAPLKQEPGDS
ncbi:MAG: signal peptidase II [Verrucomicrobiales bacterium]